MAAENLFCSICARNAPTLYCPCSGAKTNLCGECVGLHMKKHPQLHHVMASIGISAAGSTAYLQGMDRLAAGKAEFEQILAKIDRCCNELTEVVDSVVARLNSYRDECVGKLQTWKANLSVRVAEAVDEVQAALSGRGVEFRSKYSRSLRNFKPGDFDSLSSLVDCELMPFREVMRSWELLRLTRLRAPREAGRVEEGVAPTDPPIIACANCDTGVYEFIRAENGIPVGRQLYSFGNEWGVDKPQINNSSSYTLLDAKRLISCGGNRYSYIVFLRGPTKFVQLQDMNHERTFPGIVKHADHVYVFGSSSLCGGSETSGEYLPIPAERLEANKKPWTLASHTMSTQRYYFTPCAVGNFIYLCGGHSNTIDLFDIERKAFGRPAEVQLPEATGCIAFMRSSTELVVISETKASSFHVLNGTLQQGESKSHRKARIWPNSTPVLFPGDSLAIYYTCYCNKCVRVILEANNSVRTLEEVSA